MASNPKGLHSLEEECRKLFRTISEDIVSSETTKASVDIVSKGVLVPGTTAIGTFNAEITEDQEWDLQRVLEGLRSSSDKVAFSQIEERAQSKEADSGLSSMKNHSQLDPKFSLSATTAKDQRKSDYRSPEGNDTAAPARPLLPNGIQTDIAQQERAKNHILNPSEATLRNVLPAQPILAIPTTVHALSAASKKSTLGATSETYPNVKTSTLSLKSSQSTEPDSTSAQTNSTSSAAATSAAAPLVQVEDTSITAPVPPPLTPLQRLRMAAAQAASQSPQKGPALNPQQRIHQVVKQSMVASMIASSSSDSFQKAVSSMAMSKSRNGTLLSQLLQPRSPLQDSGQDMFMTSTRPANTLPSNSCTSPLGSSALSALPSYLSTPMNNTMWNQGGMFPHFSRGQSCGLQVNTNQSIQSVGDESLTDVTRPGSVRRRFHSLPTSAVAMSAKDQARSSQSSILDQYQVPGRVNSTASACSAGPAKDDLAVHQQLDSSWGKSVSSWDVALSSAANSLSSTPRGIASVPMQCISHEGGLLASPRISSLDTLARARESSSILKAVKADLDSTSGVGAVGGSLLDKLSYRSLADIPADSNEKKQGDNENTNHADRWADTESECHADGISSEVSASSRSTSVRFAAPLAMSVRASSHQALRPTLGSQQGGIRTAAVSGPMTMMSISLSGCPSPGPWPYSSSQMTLGPSPILPSLEKRNSCGLVPRVKTLK